MNHLFSMIMSDMKYICNKLYDAAEFMTYDSDFVVFKRFGRLNYFNLLRLQKCLESLDEQISKKLADGQEHEIEELVSKICDALKQYSK